MRRLFPLLLVVFLVAGCGSSSSKKTQTQTPTSSTAPAASSGGCQKVSAPAPRKPAHEKKPTAALDTSKKWSITFDTSCGSFTVDLDLKSAPKASASMVALARAGYFDQTVFHRIAPGFVIQGGDPSATGQGGPGYSTVDPPPSNARYTHGVVAMAKTQTEKAGTGGSQFFVVTAPDAGLPPDYAVIGKVANGLDVVDRIGQLGDQSEQPTQPVVIRTVKVSEG